MIYPNVVLGCDFASPQGHYVDFPSLKVEGIEFIISKATQGATSTDPTFARNVAETAAVFEFGGAYLWFEPQHDPLKQAQRFADVAGKALDKIAHPIVMIDFEDDDRNRPGGPVRGEPLVAAAEACAREIMRLLLIEPLLYSGKWFLREAVGKTPMPLLSKLPYCHAQYPRPVCPGGKHSAEYLTTLRMLAEPELPDGFTHADFRQFDGDGGLFLPQGIDADFDSFDGKREDLRRWCRARQLRQVLPDGGLVVEDSGPATTIADEVHRMQLAADDTLPPDTQPETEQGRRTKSSQRDGAGERAHPRRRRT